MSHFFDEKGKTAASWGVILLRGSDRFFVFVFRLTTGSLGMHERVTKRQKLQGRIVDTNTLIVGENLTDK